MRFLQTVKQSIYSPKFYKSVPQDSLGKAIGYFFSLIFALTIIQTLFIAVPLYIGVNTFLEQGAKTILSNYPKELQVQIQNGVVTTNVQEPYFLAIPQAMQDDTISYQHLLVIDTKTPFSQKQFTDYKSLVWVSKDSMFYKESNGQVRTTDLSNISNLTIDRSVLELVAQKIFPWLKFVAPIFIFLSLLVFLLHILLISYTYSF